MEYRLTSKLASRKFILSVLSLASLTWLVAAGHIADQVYATGLIVTVGAYLSANVVQDIRLNSKV